MKLDPHLWLIRRGFILPMTVAGAIPLGIALATRPRSARRTTGGGGQSGSPRPAARSFWIAAGVGIFALGLALLLATTHLFDRHGGSLAPWNPPTRMVIAGPYRYTRNPMISGVVLMLLGETVALRSRWLAFWCAAFALAQHLYITYDEEPTLRQRFGQEYERYCEQVGRWLPRTPSQ